MLDMESPRRGTGIRWLPALAALYSLTGGFGLLVPEIQGLEACGDFYGRRLLLCVALGGALALLGLFARSARSHVGRLVALAPLVFGASVVMNVLCGQDPLGASLNWVAPYIRYSAIDPGTETAGCYFIQNHEWVTFDLDAGVYRAGRGA